MFKAIQAYGNPLSLDVDTTITFTPGVVGELDATAGNIVLSTGQWPLGLLDDNKRQNFFRKVVDESVVLVGTTASNLTHTTLTSGAVKVTNTAKTVTYTETTDYTVNYTNGTITRVGGGSITDGQTVLVSFEYQMSAAESFQTANPVGYDDTAGSGKVTVWNAPGIYATDQYDLTQSYTLNETLYALNGIITNSNVGISGTPKGIGRVYRVPTGDAPSADNYQAPELLWLEWIREL